RLGPMDVVDDEHERPLAGERLAKPAEEPGDLGCGRRRLGLERGENGITLLSLGRLREDLVQRPVRDAVAVREAAAPERRHALRPGGELGGEARLADAGRAHDDGYLGGFSVDRALQRAAERGELALAADERSIETTFERRPPRCELDEPVCAHRIALPLEL